MLLQALLSPFSVALREGPREHQEFSAQIIISSLARVAELMCEYLSLYLVRKGAKKRVEGASGAEGVQRA